MRCSQFIQGTADAPQFGPYACSAALGGVLLACDEAADKKCTEKRFAFTFFVTCAIQAPRAPPCAHSSCFEATDGRFVPRVMRCRWSRGSFGCRWCASYRSTRSESPARPCRFKSRCRLTTTTLRSLAVATFQRANGVIVTTVPSQTSAARDRTAAIHRAEIPSITRAPCAARAATRKTVEQDSEGCLSMPPRYFCPKVRSDGWQRS